MNKEFLIKHLNLKSHKEGGFFDETYRSDVMIKSDVNMDESRNLVTCIYYMLTDDNPIGYFHINKSPIIHIYQMGAPLVYRFIYEDGTSNEQILGPDIKNGHKIQMIAPGGCWKSTEFTNNNEYDYALVTEVVSPGWDIRDCRIAKHSELLGLYPKHKDWIDKYARG